MYEREQLTYEVESQKKVVIATPVSGISVNKEMVSKFLKFQPPVPSETKGRSLRSGRTLPDPSVPPDPLLVEGESEGGSEGGGRGSGDEGELWVDNERYTHYSNSDIIMTSL